MLGVILTPYPEIAQARGGQGNYLEPYDPYYNQRGERGWYHDTQLGDIPTDAELATAYGYTPVNSGWINAREGYITGPWRGGWDPAGAYGPPTSLSGLGQAPLDPANAAAAAVVALQDQQSRAFKLMIISTSAIAISALLAAWRTAREIRKDAKRIHRDAAKIEHEVEKPLRQAPIPTYRTSADVLSRKNGSGWRLVGWTVARTLLIAPPMLVVGVPGKQAWLGAGLASGLISTLALLRIFDAGKSGLGGRSTRSLKRRYAR
jgi:hypothetical protein